MLPSTTFQTANFSIPDTMFLMVLALVVFGPRRLPEIGRQVGKLLYELRKASNDFKLQMEEELRVAEENDRLKKLQPPPIETPVLAAGSEILPVATEAAATTESTGTTEMPKEWTGEEYNHCAPTEEGTTEPVAASAIEPASEAAADTAAPILQPPSVGETVSASKPDFRTNLANLIAEGEETATDQFVQTAPTGVSPVETKSSEARQQHD